jgi:hypothetical protein
MSSSRDYDDRRREGGHDGVKGNKPDDGVRTEAERSLRRDLGDVRVHTDPAAQAAADNLGARAFTRQQDIYFAAGEYRPHDPQGRQLLLHELAHSAQQADSAGPSAPTAALEAEAARAAQAVERGERAPVALHASPDRVLKQEKGKPVAPTVQRHPEEIGPAPAQGTLTGGGFSIPYLYNVVKGAAFVPLTLQVTEGTAVIATPLTDMAEGNDYRIQNAGGSQARAVVVSVSSGLRNPPRLQLTFTRGNASYLAVFQFPGGTAKG